MATKSVVGATPVKPGTSAGTGNQSSTQEYVVRAPNNSSKKFSMIKFSTGTELDFLKLTNTTVRMERQNNLREYKTAHNLDMMPKFGAGSEYGREQKEEARRKKFGINIKKYNPDDQPWLMKVGKGKDAKRYKGVREGTITENTSYYIFTQCADGAFEAFPIEEWYNFQPVVQYKYLNSEEAEEEFLKRDKTMNMFSIMVRKRIKKEEDNPEEQDAEEKKTSKKKDKSLILTDMEEWGLSSDDAEDDEEGEDGENKPKKEKKKEKQKKGRKNAKHNDDDEAVEESDEGDFDDRELDYISDSGSESSLDEKEKNAKYDDQGVDQEHGLKKLIDSEEESSEEENKEEEENEEENPEEEEGPAAGKEKKKKKEKKEGNKDSKEGDESDSSSSSSESDESDIEKNEDKFSSVLFMQKKKGSSRSNTPTFDKSADASKVEQKQEAVKRKMEAEDTTDSQKKLRTESPVAPSASAGSLTNSGEITEEAIRRYLTRKPMTAKELVQKFKSKKPQITKEQMTQRIGQLLKKINPDKKYLNGILYLSLKNTD